MKKPRNVSWVSYIRNGLIARARKTIVRGYYKILLKQTPVWNVIEHFKREAKKNGIFTKEYAYYAKYYILYHTVRRLKPAFVLECGSGISTLIILEALARNGTGTLVTMDELPQFAEGVAAIAGKRENFELHISPSVRDTYKGIRGHRYQSLPLHPYDFVFVDGPTTDGADLDAFYVLEKNPRTPILIDCRTETVRALTKEYNGRFSPLLNLGFVNF